MEYICNLNVKGNTCPYLIGENRCKDNNSSCCFKKSTQEKPREPYVRKERWYEKYYKK